MRKAQLELSNKLYEFEKSCWIKATCAISTWTCCSTCCMFWFSSFFWTCSKHVAAWCYMFFVQKAVTCYCNMFQREISPFRKKLKNWNIKHKAVKSPSVPVKTFHELVFTINIPQYSIMYGSPEEPALSMFFFGCSGTDTFWFIACSGTNNVY